MNNPFFLQVGFASFLCIVALVAHVQFKPYMHRSIYNLELASLSVIAFTFFVAIYIKVLIVLKKR